MRRLAKDYIAIYHTDEGCKQVWAAPIKKDERTQVVCISIDDPEKSADYITPKINALAFDINDQDITILDVKAKVQQAFAVNSEKLTKSFYDGFKKQHKTFAAFIQGIDDQISATENKNKQWYASIMLNRLMFCYFIQKKGFLNGDFNYLTNKLEYVKQNEGDDKYFKSFYKEFLLRLFSEGLNTPGRHNPDFVEKFGNIPYLNGGLFDLHTIEIQYSGIQIPDAAFENLFKFFDEWNWHLDTRITASGRDINPDVLGYIFEQYINDRAQMGAYYTKEDITGYIAKNCIIPFIFDKMAGISAVAKHFRPTGYVWQHLKNSGSTYIYDAMKRGAENWQQNLPPEISDGIDTQKPDLLQRRRLWNTPADQKSALPTETWREAIARHQRCDAIAKLIADGSITDSNSLITNNLNILEFAIDIIRNVDMEQDYLFIKNFYKILKSVTILDPTCGSGAFLFAALNILEPLYEECIAKMKTAPARFEDELGEIAVHYRSNDQYFIFKSIILRNLYGVDIMPEAIEVAKLRLFLKLVAVVDCDPHKENLGLDPLPDIDFNIRCGNTLVGYANEHELEVANYNEDMFTVQDFRDKVAEEMEKISLAYKRYRDIQLNQQKEERIEDFKQSKDELQRRLAALNTLLNKRLHSAKPNILSLENWTAQTRPFHWIAEFYEIIHNGGFDVIIGNPPYVEYSKVKKTYTINNIKCIDAGNLYAYVIERSLYLQHLGSRNGMIIQMSAFCTPRMKPFQKIWFENAHFSALSFFDDRPGKLFDIEHIRVVICLLEKGTPSKVTATTNYNKFYSQCRGDLFKILNYHVSDNSRKDFAVIKMSSDLEEDIVNKLWKQNKTIANYENATSNDNYIYYGYGYGYFGKILNYHSYFKGELISSSTGDKFYYINNDYNRNMFVGILNSSLFYWFYVNYSDGHNFTKTVIGTLPYKYVYIEKLNVCVENLMEDLQRKANRKIANYKSTGKVEYDEYHPSLSKPLIDEIDKVLASHYGFTEEELDFIINYDIKYRMGDELGEE